MEWASSVSQHIWSKPVDRYPEKKSWDEEEADCWGKPVPQYSRHARYIKLKPC
jgi:hypothetical protein